MASATVLALYLQKHSAMNGSQNRCDFSFVGPHLFFNLPCICHCPEVQRELPARQKEDAIQSCHPRYVWERCLSAGGAGRASVLGTPRLGMEGAGAAACELAFLPLLRASYFALVRPLCLPGARPC